MGWPDVLREIRPSRYYGNIRALKLVCAVIFCCISFGVGSARRRNQPVVGQHRPALCLRLVGASTASAEGTGWIILVRYADDFVMGIQYAEDARRMLEDLKEQFYGLPSNTRCLMGLLHHTRRAWFNSLRRRGQRRFNRETIGVLLAHILLPLPRMTHPSVA
jgi:hypothetical protein